MHIECVAKKNSKKGYMQTSHWSDVTTGEAGSMVREAIRRGSEAVEREAQVENGAVHQNAK